MTTSRTRWPATQELARAGGRCVQQELDSVISQDDDSPSTQDWTEDKLIIRCNEIPASPNDPTGGYFLSH